MTAESDREQLVIGAPQWVDGEVQRYLDSGDYDSSFANWPGDNYVDIAKKASQRLRTALVEETLRRANGRGGQVTVPDDLRAWPRNKLSPMIFGLFPADERSVVLDTLGGNVVFLTPQNIASVLMEQRWPSTAWNLANVYLRSVGAPALAHEACQIVGLSEQTTCYISMSYFQETDPFADFVVHEAAHAFHNCKRATVGLRESSRGEHLLNIEYAKRETFAYACEAYSRISSMAAGVKQRLETLERHADGFLPPDDRVDHEEYLDILGEAVKSRNGWKRILKRCAPNARQ
ncbi:hypothetical protein PPMP20_17945 [Paraburkholderia phymatum]|uniref:Uncharacterized protein n=1 Tax=Paraburkholderia phymatum (strain DSM 17167 / CIP 108236 / LMG 21445 / STM815) TaxID=391038 RepID=B2JTP8_PARP8|nr:hypothetical protein [Paraburkholderia phymatum]ACC75951.1 hypothetical protein Bphy_6941 [Paraburkholderia phymatum STM815]